MAAKKGTATYVFGHTAPFTLEEVQGAAWRLAEWAPITGAAFNPNSAIGKAWLADKSIGTAVTPELPTSDGLVAVILASGKVIHWLGGDSIEII
jgi:hypothetical protein